MNRGGTEKMLITESRYLLDGYFVYNSFNFSVWLNFFKIKSWPKNKLKTQDIF